MSIYIETKIIVVLESMRIGSAMESAVLNVSKIIDFLARSDGSRISTLALSLLYGKNGRCDLGALPILLFLTSGFCNISISLVFKSLNKDVMAVLFFQR